MLSVVIPVYNACTYLEKCVRSVVTFCDSNKIAFEIVLVDDGSTDGSSNICDDLCTNDCRISVIHQKNQGVSAARNAGLEKVMGDWVWFVDSDDYILPVSANIGQLEEFNFVVLGFVWDEKGTINEFGASSGETPYNLWRCWFKKENIIQYNLKFKVGRKYAEDQEFILKYLVNVKRSSDRLKACAVDTPLYYYTIREGSAMTKRGVKGKMLSDISSVLFSFISLALKNKILFTPWSLYEIKRLVKTIIVTAKM